MKKYLQALAFLSILPLPRHVHALHGRDLAEAAAYFPLVGLTLGFFMAGAAWAALPLFPLPVVAVLALVLNFFLTRGLHLDGLADTADGLMGPVGRDKALWAMADSAVGAMGAVALILVLALKIALLASFSPLQLLPALFFMPLAGRWAMVYAGSLHQPARDEGLGSLFLRELGYRQLLRASLGAVIFLGAVALIDPALAPALLLGCLGALAGAHILAALAARRLGGLTGDILGAVGELGETLFLCFFFALAAGGGEFITAGKVAIACVLSLP